LKISCASGSIHGDDRASGGRAFDAQREPFKFLGNGTITSRSEIPVRKARLDRDLQLVLEAFRQLTQKAAAQEVSLLKAEFLAKTQTVEIGFDELSDANRNLMSL
jgi:hypothetical protein